MSSSSTAVKILGPFFLWLAALLMAAMCLYWVSEAVLSVAGYGRVEGGEVYYHHGGFTQSPSLADRAFGDVVRAVDELGTPESSGRQLLFLGGLVVSSVEGVKEKTETEWDGMAPIGREVVGYTMRLLGNLANGRFVDLPLKTSEWDNVSWLKEATGTLIYLLVRSDPHKFELLQCGSAAGPRGEDAVEEPSCRKEYGIT